MTIRHKVIERKAMLVLIDDKTKQALLQAFDEIQQPRTPFALEKLVVGNRFTAEQQYAQCVLEMSIAYDNLRLAQLGCQKKELEMQELPNTPVGKIDRGIKEIELEQTGRAMLGATREFAFLFDMWKRFPKRYTRDELNAASPREYQLQLQTQALHDKEATGRIGVSNLEGLRQIGMNSESLELLPSAVTQGVSSDQVEQRYLAEGKCRILIGIPSEKKLEDGAKCIEGLVYPAGAEVKLFNNYGNPVAAAYNFIAQEALNDDADLLITIEDDTFPQPDALVRLVDFVRKNPRTAIGAWYPKREEYRQGVHIIVGKNERGPLHDDGEIHEVYTLAMGCSVYPVQMFREIQRPWFKTSPQLTQDSYFSQLAREAGWKLLVDTSIKCRHIDRDTGKVYE
ncbi:hypothetical protein UFOVP276_120 [uncultured Caudovirales phage]|uniref:Uncharacterized protein n=1 Tax=uncultured Caudovirales phage TaxID=2100421 RepID=A0A6J5LKW0_9CAUD|nr:hypothetical protein UFOVP276_120 [uncultured Caudovirales phage]